MRRVVVRLPLSDAWNGRLSVSLSGLDLTLRTLIRIDGDDTGDDASSSHREWMARLSETTLEHMTPADLRDHIALIDNCIASLSHLTCVHSFIQCEIHEDVLITQTLSDESLIDSTDPYVSLI